MHVCVCVCVCSKCGTSRRKMSRILVRGFLEHVSDRISLDCTIGLCNPMNSDPKRGRKTCDPERRAQASDIVLPSRSGKCCCAPASTHAQCLCSWANKGHLCSREHISVVVVLPRAQTNGQLCSREHRCPALAVTPCCVLTKCPAVQNNGPSTLTIPAFVLAPHLCSREHITVGLCSRRKARFNLNLFGQT
jgi:hypothetical protein